MSAQLQRRQRPPRLSQHLVTCPGCNAPSAAHVDPTGDGVGRLVRLVCPNACPLSDSDVVQIAASLCESPEQVAHALSA